MSNKIEIIKTVNGKEEKQIFYVSDEAIENKANEYLSKLQAFTPMKEVYSQALKDLKQQIK